MYSINIPEDDLRKIETSKSVEGLYVIIHIILTYSAFVGSIQ